MALPKKQLFGKLKSIRPSRKTYSFEPKGDGILIFDEVKVVKSRSQKIIGLAVTPDEMVSLHICFAQASNKKMQQTMYIISSHNKATTSVWIRSVCSHV